MKALVVEDDVVSRHLMEKVLEQQGHEVLTCASAEDALPLINEHEIDIILVDLLLPGMHGLDLCRRLRTSPKDIYILVVTGDSQSRDLEAILEAGANDYLPKPMTMATLGTRLKIAAQNIERNLQRQQAQKAVYLAHEDLQRLMYNLPLAIVIHQRGKILSINPKALTLLGYKEGDALVGRELKEVVPLQEQHIRKQLWAHHSHKTPGTRPIEVRIQRFNQKPVIIELSPPQPIHWQGKMAGLMVASDITERKHIQSQLLLSDRMSSVGTMAAGVAHEINNPLSYVISNLGIAKETLEKTTGDLPKTDRKELHELLQDCIEGSGRVASIVKDLKTYTSLDDAQVGPVDVHQLLSMALTMSHSQLRDTIEVIREDDPKLPHAKGNEAKLAQILLNLLSNAIQALWRSDRQNKELRITTSHEGHEVVLKVVDNGEGIQAEDIPHIFEPFFTTQSVGNGAGLGLFVCHNLVKSMGGDIQISSEPGQGTTVCVRLQVAPPRPSPSNHEDA